VRRDGTGGNGQNGARDDGTGQPRAGVHAEKKHRASRAGVDGGWARRKEGEVWAGGELGQRKGAAGLAEGKGWSWAKERKLGR
jgi:hypothetical protein